MLMVKLLASGAKVPTRATEEAAGYDLYAPADVSLLPGKVTKVPLGFAIAIPAGHVGLIKDRSSMGGKGIHVFGGVLDSDYRGELVAVLFNSAGEFMNWGGTAIPSEDRRTVHIAKGDRIAQLVVVPCYQGATQLLGGAEELPPTARIGGFGSTGT